MTKVMYVFLFLALVFGVMKIFIGNDDVVEQDDIYACTKEAKLCPDGSAVGREGPNCEFAACPSIVPDDIQAHIDSKTDLIKLNSPLPTSVVNDPIAINGEARGVWYFEASFPIILTDWDGRIIAESFATAEGEWMTEEFVPFSASLAFDNPYKEGDPDFMKRGTLILKKDNPSGLPEHDDALEIPVKFAP